MGRSKNATLLTVFLSSFFLFTLKLMAFHSPGLSDVHNPIVDETYTVADFSYVVMETQGNLLIQQGDREALTIEGSKHRIDQVRILVVGDVLYIRPKANFENPKFSDSSHERPLIYHLNIVDLKGIDLTNDATVQSKPIRTKSFSAKLNGGTTGNLILYVDELNVTLDQAARLKLQGSAETQRIVLSGSSRYIAQSLRSNSCHVEMRENATGYVYASEELEGNVTDQGKLYYVDIPKEYRVATTNLATASPLGQQEKTPRATSGDLPKSEHPNRSGMNLDEGLQFPNNENVD